MSLVSFTFNGQSSSLYPWLIVNKIEGPILPPIENKLTQVPGRSGAFHMSKQYGVRPEALKITVLGDTQEELAAHKRTLAAWLNTDSTKPFIYNFEPNMEYQAILDGSTDLDKIVTDGETTLNFVMPNPFAYGPAQNQMVAGGVDSVSEDTDTQGEWNTGTLTNVTATPTGLQLQKEGTDYTYSEQDWATGTLTQTQKLNNHLALATYTQATNATHTDDFTSGTFTDTIKSGTELTMANLPTWDFTDDMSAYLSTGWVEFIDAADPGIGTITQETGHVRCFSDNKDVAIRYNPTGTFPKTYDFVYKLDQANASNAKTTRCLARFVENRAGSLFAYATYLSSTGGAWKWARIVIRNTTTADLYIDGVFDRNVTATTTSLTQRVQFFMDAGLDQGDFRLSHFQMRAGILLPSQVASYPFPYTGSHVSPEYDLSSLGTYVNGVANFTTTTPTGIEGFHSSSKVEVDIYKSGTWQGYQQMTNGGSLPHLTNGDNLNGVKARIRETLNTYDVANPAKIQTSNIVVNGSALVSYTSGSRTSTANAGVQPVAKAKSAILNWTETKPAGTNIRAYVALEVGGVLGSFQEVTNGGSIPQISPSTNLSNTKLVTRFDLTTSNVAVTPEVITASYTLLSAYKTSGERISSGLVLNVLDVDDSLITWDGTPNASPNIQVDIQIVTTGNSPLPGDWVSTTNGQPIPGIIPGASLAGKSLFTRTRLSSDAVTAPVVHRLLWQVDQAGGNVITYEATEKSYPVITVTFTANVATFEITHQETGNRLYFPRSFAIGNVLVIDNSKGKVILNGQLISLSLYSDFVYLQPGNNTFVMSPGNSCIASADWRGKYL